MSQTDKVIEDVERALDVAHSRVLARGQRKVADAAQTLSRRNLAAAKAHLLNQAIQTLIGLCYEADDDRMPANVDPVTGRILLDGLPWGRLGREYYGLHPQEAAVLRWHMLALCAPGEPMPPLFDWDERARSWHLNFRDYPTQEMAMGYWEGVKMAAKRWREGVKELSVR